MILLALAASVLGAQGTTARAPPTSIYEERPLKLPQIDLETKCPVSVGRNDIVSSAHQYIFGAGGYFFGAGPVYFALSWRPVDRAAGQFELLDRMPRVANGYRLKTPWIVHPGYEGEALVRGARIGVAVADQILFRDWGPALVLHSRDPSRSLEWERRVGAMWGFWPTSMILPGPGCYAIQIDTESKSDIVIFEATVHAAD